MNGQAQKCNVHRFSERRRSVDSRLIAGRFNVPHRLVVRRIRESREYNPGHFLERRTGRKRHFLVTQTGLLLIVGTLGPGASPKLGSREAEDWTIRFITCSGQLFDWARGKRVRPRFQILRELRELFTFRDDNGPLFVSEKGQRWRLK